MANYHELSPTLQERIQQEQHLFPMHTPLRRRESHAKDTLWRPSFIRDTETILHSPYYNRYTDKTQVFSLYQNDDISRRSFHVQLVSRIARNIGRLLGLDLDLIEAIALGHDMGHTPFGHAGEAVLSDLYQSHTGRKFLHNVHSVRVLDGIFHHNLTLQTLDGILCHNGELELSEYRPVPIYSFRELDARMEKCETEAGFAETLVPCTLEGCVVRISDIIAYIGKDRQDAVRTGLLPHEELFRSNSMGAINAELIHNLIIDIVEHSYGKGFIAMSEEGFRALVKSKKDNYAYIYTSPEIAELRTKYFEPMFEKMYEALLSDLKTGNEQSEIFRNHLSFVKSREKFYHAEGYENTEPNRITTDFIASMTDSYFVALYDKIFGDMHIPYHSYFE